MPQCSTSNSALELSFAFHIANSSKTQLDPAVNFGAKSHCCSRFFAYNHLYLSPPHEKDPAKTITTTTTSSDHYHALADTNRKEVLTRMTILKYCPFTINNHNIMPTILSSRYVHENDDRNNNSHLWSTILPQHTTTATIISPTAITPFNIISLLPVTTTPQPLQGRPLQDDHIGA
ncbi:hypothetical protein BDN72DRAFT_959959 [Pluteus cervinus]|uniref:Uncharacterized protein n=1 Tax=Pluteus cervinus TaxID=181527 RepID=A0ACD3AST2_9AGAR|nr:hypothetical protein BDN72DRAFT_959959 [Pluteus cervinus]